MGEAVVMISAKVLRTGIAMALIAAAAAAAAQDEVISSGIWRRNADTGYTGL
jgi:hypothetical protein